MTSTDGIWVGTKGAAAIIGTTPSGVIILIRDGKITPDCLACGRNRYKVKEMEARAEELKAYLTDTYSGSLDDLILNA